MDKRVHAVEEGDEVGVAVQEPRLKYDLLDGEKKAEERIMLSPEDSFAMTLSKIPYVAPPRKESCGQVFGDGVSDEVENPIEHLDQEGEFRKHTAVIVVSEAGGIRRSDGGQTAACSRFRCMP